MEPLEGCVESQDRLVTNQASSISIMAEVPETQVDELQNRPIAKPPSSSSLIDLLQEIAISKTDNL